MDTGMGKKEMIPKILAFDPGESVGWCLLRPPMEVMESGTLYFEDYSGILEKFNVLFDYDKVVVEDFRLYPGKGEDLAWDSMPAPQCIGALKVIFWWTGRPSDMDFLMPSSKQSVPDDLLEEMGIDWSTPHERDAIKLALNYSLFEMDYQQHEEVQEVLRRWMNARTGAGYTSRRSKM